MPLFIPLLLCLSLFSFLFVTKDYSKEYTAAFLVTSCLWIFSFLAFHHIKLSIERYGAESSHKLLKIYVVLHFLMCIGQLVRIMVITDTINPYVGLPFPYGMSTGDNVFGTFMQNSLYNVTVSGFLTLYFIYRRHWFLATLSSICVILVFSNFGTIVFVGVLSGVFFAGLVNNLMRGNVKWIKRIAPPKYYALYIPFFISLVAVLYVTISPDNTKYFVDKVKSKIFSIDVSAKDNYHTIIADTKQAPAAYDVDSADYHDKKVLQYANDRNKAFNIALQKSEKAVGKSKIEIMREMTGAYVHKLQGKSLAVLETKQYLQSSTKRLLFGAGASRFSSHIAQKMAGFDSSRLFMNVLPHFVATEYKENHMLLIEERIKSTEEYFSTANFPDSFYNQIFGEYGILGAMLFIIFYVGYFFKYRAKWSYGFWLFLILLPFAHLSYIFDTLCVMPFFEWLMLLDIEQEKT